MTEETETNLADLPAERLAEMLREKRRAEADVRAKLRDAEAERDTLRGHVAAWQGERLLEAARAAQVHETALSDLSQHIQLSDLLTGDSRLDPDKTAEVFDSLKASKPHLFDVPRVGGRSSNGDPAPSGGTVTHSAASWADVVTPQ